MKYSPLPLYIELGRRAEYREFFQRYKSEMLKQADAPGGLSADEESVKRKNIPMRRAAVCDLFITQIDNIDGPAPERTAAR